MADPQRSTALLLMTHPDLQRSIGPAGGGVLPVGDAFGARLDIRLRG